MFTMPPGAEVDESIDVNELFPFEHGVVTVDWTASNAERPPHRSRPSLHWLGG